MDVILSLLAVFCLFLVVVWWVLWFFGPATEEVPFLVGVGVVLWYLWLWWYIRRRRRRQRGEKMSVISQCVWRGDAHLGTIRSILGPRVLAEGYDLHAEDEGKQVFIRGRDALSRAKRPLSPPPLYKLQAALKLTISYVRVPAHAEVRFTWETPYLPGWYDGDAASWLDAHRKTFLAYLDEWLGAADAGELEQT